MTTILLARHGETDWNAEGRWQGHSDPPLNETGREQARALAERLADEPLDAIYASDLRRASETAEIVAGRKGMTVKTLADFREINAGTWEGLTAPEIEERFPDAFPRWRETGEPGWEQGETHEAMAARAVAAARSLAERHPGERILVVCHGGPMKAILMYAEGSDYLTQRRDTPRIENCELREIAVSDGTFRRID